MKISRDKLYRLIVEEYLLSEGLQPGNPEVEDLLRRIMGDKYRPPEERDPTRYARHGGDTAPMEKPHTAADDTMPLPIDDMPQYDDEGVDDGGAYDPEAEAEISGPPMDQGPLEDQIAALVQGMPPEEVSDLFQAVFSKIPGVELGPPEDEEPESLYSPGAEGRPTISLGPLREAVLKKIYEGAGLSYGAHSMAGVPGNRDEEERWHDMGGEDEMYNVLDPHGFEEMSDAELVDAAHRDGIEEMIVLDGEGDLANREEVIAALKDV
tara:strand:+ start:3910 stop:4707 length:798 start_codon:yes stop_codon:yes gene_type:complete